MLKYLYLVMALGLTFTNNVSWAAKPPANKPPTVSLTAPATGATFAAPATIMLTATASDVDGTIARVEFYQGNSLIGSKTAAPYSVTWTNVLAGTYALTAKAYDNATAYTTSAAVSVTVTGVQISVSNPANGAVVAGSTVTVNGTFSGDSSASVWVDNGNSSRLATLSNNNFSTTIPIFPGPNTLTISVARTNKTVDSTSLSITGTDYPKIAFTSPTTATYDAPATVIFAVDAISPAGSINKVTFLSGSTVLATATSPPFQFTWHNAPKGNYWITAQAVDNHGYTSSAYTAINVQGANIPPAIAITSPADGSSFQGPANIPLTVSASDSDGTISLVRFYRNGTLISSTNVAPFSATAAAVPVGSHSFTAEALDDRDAATMSAPVTITVTSPNTLPTVSLTEPQDGSVFHVANESSSATISLAAIAADSDGAIDRVEFYRGSTLIGTARTPPYGFQWTDAVQGSHVLTAKAIDNLGGTATSLPATVTVKSNETITYLHNDFLGSAIGATDANGAVLWRESYQPYGERIRKESAASGNRQFYTGKPDDTDIGLSYFGARYYDPVVGRFMGVDPVDFVEGNIHSFNRYGYANNNPYKFVDPDGKWAIPAIVLGLIFYEISPLSTPEAPAHAPHAIYPTAGPFEALAAAAGATRSISSSIATGASKTTGQFSKETIGRKSLGRDGARSEQIIEREGGDMISRTHRVTKDGKVIHQHQNHIGKAGGERQFPDEWTGTKTIGEGKMKPPYENVSPSFGPDK